MDLLTAFFLISGAASLFSLIYAVVQSRRGRHEKALVYDVSPAASIASVLRHDSKERLSITYEAVGQAPMHVHGAVLRFVRVGNLGREPIHRADIAPADPLAIHVKGTRVLEWSVADSTRPVVRFSVTPLGAESEEVSARIDFDFLDYHDAGMVRILTAGRGKISVTGTIIGMPGGLRSLRQIARNPLRSALGKALSVALYVAFAAGAVLAFYSATGDWTRVWILFLPLVVLIAPTAIIIAVGETIWPKTRWPQGLGWPRWFPWQGYPDEHAYVLAGSPRRLSIADEEDVGASPPR